LPDKAIANDAVETVKRERPLAKNVLYYKNGSAHIERSLDIDDHENLDKHNNSVNMEVAGNEVLLQQAVLNLLYNAHDAVVASESVAPQVKISVSRHGSSVDLSVSDNGQGISPQMRERLFKPFESESGNQGGLGLGLTLAEQIAEDHNGSLICTDADGGGCVFTLTDDDIDVLAANARFLRINHFEVIVANSAEKALEYLETASVTVVVTDLRMPGKDGIAFAKDARALHPLLPILFFSGFARVPDVVNAMKLGAVDFLEKPVDPEELLARLQDIVDPGSIAISTQRAAFDLGDSWQDQCGSGRIENQQTHIE